MVHTTAGYSDTETRARLIAVGPPLTVLAITPNSGAQVSTVAIANLAGTGFQAGARVRLVRPGSAEVPATDVVVVSPTRITCRFALPVTGGMPSTWNVVVTAPGGKNATLPGGFTVSGTPGTVVISRPGSYVLANDIAESALPDLYRDPGL